MGWGRAKVRSGRGTQALIDRLGPAVAEHIRANPLLALAADRRLTNAHLWLFAHSQLAAQPAEVAASAQLTLRTPPGSATGSIPLVDGTTDDCPPGAALARR